MKRAVLTGGTGFVGANLARRLLIEGYEVHLLVRSNHNLWRIKEIVSQVERHEADLLDKDALFRTLDRIGPDRVFHLAVHGAYSWQNDAQRIFAANVTGTANLLNAALRVGFEAFVNTGSSSEYGFKDHAPAEDEDVEPNSDYARTKVQATRLCTEQALEHGAHIPTLRLYSVYGRYEDPGRLIPTLVTEGLQGKWPPLVNPEVARDYVYIDDVCDAYLLAASSRTSELGPIYNVGTGVQTSIRQVVETARRVMGIEAEPQWGTMPNRRWDTDVWVANNEKIKRELGWKPRFSFKAGLSELVRLHDRNDVP